MALLLVLQAGVSYFLLFPPHPPPKEDSVRRLPAVQQPVGEHRLIILS